MLIKTPFLSIAREGVITVENQGTGKAGELKIDVDVIEIDGGKITAAATKDDGRIVINTSKIKVL